MAPRHSLPRLTCLASKHTLKSKQTLLFEQRESWNCTETTKHLLVSKALEQISIRGTIT